ncbi:small kinetochore-associated protein [Platysternon megacephalum]|uniref:Small kinetochore-associated protein n=1 Tax=Platysternon megacephalum TaxID=55544 RepID=A0A4D9EXR0_9SAUR|nr:small kinetochore-associated protein [Platysternon megacephalum]
MGTLGTCHCPVSKEDVLAMAVHEESSTSGIRGHNISTLCFRQFCCSLPMNPKSSWEAPSEAVRQSVSEFWVSWTWCVCLGTLQEQTLFSLRKCANTAPDKGQRVVLCHTFAGLNNMPPTHCIGQKQGLAGDTHTAQ